MNKAIFIFDTYEMVWRLEQALWLCPSMRLSANPQSDIRRYVEQWMARALLEINCMPVNYNPQSVPSDVSQTFDEHLRLYERRIYKGLRVPEELSSEPAHIGVYHKDLWLVYRYYK